MRTVYVLENRANGKCYVGQTCNLKKRLFQHGQKGNLIGNAIRKNGLSGFRITTSEVPDEMTDALEKNLICLYGSIAPGGYNLDSGGNAEKKRHAITRRKISETRKARGLGFIVSPEVRRRINANLRPCQMRGKHHSEETKKKMSEARGGSKNANYGKSDRGWHHTQEAKDKISAARRRLIRMVAA